MRKEEEVSNQEESIVQASNVSQPVEQAVRRPRRHPDKVARNKLDIREEVVTILLIN